MRLLLSLPVLLVALWMVCEGPSLAQAGPEPSSILDAIPDIVKESAHTLGNKDQGVPDKLKKNDSASMTWAPVLKPTGKLYHKPTPQHLHVPKDKHTPKLHSTKHQEGWLPSWLPCP
ncbi:apolipoprotein C-I-like [Diceros bicornis minor]|uniref:apolipoprotein C-I-like n=1 Tax=Diceros bicornis minor TaxID=77932 RepID=UPI0026EA1B2E|nr:apolipoprotein C-I-like [Diceros bicornis minor]